MLVEDVRVVLLPEQDGGRLIIVIVVSCCMAGDFPKDCKGLFIKAM